MPEKSKLLRERTREFSQLESWNISLVKPGERSRLYSLEPMSLGTPEVEALSSFIAELADCHCVSVIDLISIELIRFMRPDLHNTEVSTESRRRRTIGFNKWVGVNSAGNLVSEVVSALKDTTGVEGLEALTMLPLSGYLRPNLTHERRKWCWMCLNQFRDTKRPFEPLLWSALPVLVCPTHRVPLEEHCPECGRDSVALQSFSRPGYCPHCSAWLGSKSISQLGEACVDDAMLTAAIFTGDLLAHLPTIPSYTGNNIVRTNLKRLMEVTTDGSQTAFFKACGLPVDNDLCSNPPTLKALASIAVRLKIPMTAFFRADSEHLDAIWEGSVHEMDATILRSMRAHNKKLGLLQAVDLWPPVSLETVAQELGYRSTIPLLRTHKDLATRVKLRYSEWSRTSSRADQRTQSIKSDAVSAALRAALLQDEPPPITEIAKGLGFFDSRPFGYYYPELCEAIVRKREEYREAQLKSMECMIISALDEDPVPTLKRLSKRLGLKYFNMITDRFPELSATLIVRRKEQHSRRIQEIRDVLEALLRRPTLKWDEVIAATGIPRGSFRHLFPVEAKRLSTKIRETSQATRADLFSIAKKNIKKTVEELERRGVEPSIEVVWNAIPRLPYHGKTMVERILRILRSESRGLVGSPPLTTEE